MQAKIRQWVTRYQVGAEVIVGKRIGSNWEGED